MISKRSILTGQSFDTLFSVVVDWTRVTEQDEI